MTDTSARYLVTCAHCAVVVELVWSGGMSVTDGIDRLIVFRHSGTSEQRMSAVVALQNFACNPDLWIARAARRVLHERFVDDSWLLFTQYREAMAQTRREYDEVVTAVQHYLAAVEEVTIQQNPEHADSLESS